MGPIGFPDLFFLGVLVSLAGLVAILPFWMIFSKAGFSGWMSLTQIIPIVNVIALFYLAFAEWPIYRDLERLRPPQAGL